MGRITSHILWKIKNVPNHQPVLTGAEQGMDGNGGMGEWGYYY